MAVIPAFNGIIKRPVTITLAEKLAIIHDNRAALDLVSGTNTGDQDLSGKESVGVAASLDNAHLGAFAHGDIAHANRAALDLVSGSNTGDQTNITGNSGTTTAALGLKSATTTVVISGAIAPTVGQVLTAISPTEASWQAGASDLANIYAFAAAQG